MLDSVSPRKPLGTSSEKSATHGPFMALHLLPTQAVSALPSSTRCASTDARTSHHRRHAAHSKQQVMLLAIKQVARAKGSGASKFKTSRSLASPVRASYLQRPPAVAAVVGGLVRLQGEVDGHVRQWLACP
eukprot:scaffold631_cov378-Prasinococcus_capsulatus_cf.AAC.9